jgi:hypothetical protein
MIALMMEAVSTSETSLKFYLITWRNIPKDTAILAAVRTRNLTDILTRFCPGRVFNAMHSDGPHYPSVSYNVFAIRATEVY